MKGYNMSFSDEAKNTTQSATLLLQQVKSRANIGITCLYFNLFPDITVPMLSKVLEQNPLIAGFFFEERFCTAS